jgi:hypothetical protein
MQEHTIHYGVDDQRVGPGSGMCTQWSFLEKVMGYSDQHRGCGVSMLTWPISLAFDRYYLLLFLLDDHRR